jgi:carbamoyltransferase
MLICGLKLTHDGTVAVVADGRLLFSVELEKLANNRRYSVLSNLDQVLEILAGQGLDAADIDAFVVDGWQAPDGAPYATLPVTADDTRFELSAAPYHERVSGNAPRHRYRFDGLRLGGQALRYSSYHHATDHLLSAYCTSPFAQRQEDALVLVWDAGMLPHLYHVSGKDAEITAQPPLFPLAGSAFAYLAAQLPPFHRDTTGMNAEDRQRSHLEVAGKAMAYAGLGRDEPAAYPMFDRLWDAIGAVTLETPLLLAEQIVRRRDELFPGLSDADLICSYQAYLGEQLLTSMKSRLADNAGEPPNLCLVGGCALNIKWNSALRRSGLFRDIWVPPFPNDTGVALGAACAELVHTGGTAALQWDVYAGPQLTTGPVPSGWTASTCDEEALGRLLHDTGEPVVYLTGRAELGPRALGNRSILAAPVRASMKNLLNDIKDRAPYRPVAPVCIEDRAPEIFDPGVPDPYMLFDHRVRPQWTERIPAVMHVDGTARLQTITAAQHPSLVRVLTAYERSSGVPVLCNTSANLKGRGFFPDVASAVRWGGTPYVWSDGVLYRRRGDAGPATP